MKQILFILLALLAVFYFSSTDVSAATVATLNALDLPLVGNFSTFDFSISAMTIAGVAAVSVVPDVSQLLRITQTEFDEMKAKHGHIYIVNIEIDESEKYQFFAKRPSKNCMAAVAANKADLDKANEILLKNTIVAGDTDSLEDGIVYMRVLKELGSIFKQGKSSFTKA